MSLATKFGAVTKMQQGSPLSNEQLMRVAPSIFAEEGHHSRSMKYTYIPTIEVVEALRKEGFQPFSACQSKSRTEGKAEFTKHMLRLRHINEIATSEANEIILVNSHDGSSSYQMIGGMFRFVCQNGMVTGDVVEDIRVRHMGNVVDNVIDGAYSLVERFDSARESMELMKEVTLNRPEQIILAKASLALKYDSDENKQPITYNQLLTPKRMADRGESVWTSFSVIQENLLKGGIRGVSANGRKITTRSVNSIDNNVKLNRALWILADEMAKLKA